MRLAAVTRKITLTIILPNFKMINSFTIILDRTPSLPSHQPRSLPDDRAGGEGVLRRKEDPLRSLPHHRRQRPGLHQASDGHGHQRKPANNRSRKDPPLLIC
jgi:hypothetical protein